MRVRRLLPGCVVLGLWLVESTPAQAFPSLVLERHGYWGTAPNDTCCEARLAGWGPKGEPVVLSSGWDQDQQAFHFSLEIHDPQKDGPEEILSVSSFRDDDGLPFKCREGQSALKCFWSAREGSIRTAMARLKVKPATGKRLMELPPYEVDWIRHPTGGEPTLSFDQGPDGILFHLPDTSMPGNHLLPLGMVSSSSPHARWMVMSCQAWGRYDDGPIEKGVRFLRFPEAERPQRLARARR